MKIQKYYNIITSLIRIRYKNRWQFRIFRRVLNLGLQVMGDKSNGLAWDDNNHFSKILLVFLAKNLHRLQSILILCKRGFAKDVIPLLRSMFEELVDLKYMQADKKRIEDYFNYDTYIRLKLGRTLLAHGGKGVDKEKIGVRNAELEKEWDKVKNKFTDKKGNVHKRWTCKSVADVSTEVGLGEAYHYIFGYLSNYIHSNPISANDYVLGREGDNVVIEIGASPQLVREVLPTASMFFVDMLSIVNDEYKMRLDDDLKSLADQLTGDKTKYESEPIE